MRATIFIMTAVALTSVPSVDVPASAVARPPVASAQATRFRAFFDGFRRAVLAGDRNAVAEMTRLPFNDFRDGRYCEPGLKNCRVSTDTATSRDRAEFLAKYDRIFTPAAVAAIRANRTHGFRPGDDDGEVGGPIAKGEYLLDAEETGDQRVFVPVGDSWKLARVPLYS